jgi:hypothetical protein
MVGLLTLTRALDREQLPVHNFQVRVSDGFTPNDALVDVTVNVLDVNDNAPIITLNASRVNLKEEQIRGI